MATNDRTITELRAELARLQVWHRRLTFGLMGISLMWVVVAAALAGFGGRGFYPRVGFAATAMVFILGQLVVALLVRRAERRLAEQQVDHAA